MKTFSKKLTAIVMLAILSFSAFIIGFATLYRAPAIAENAEFSHDNLTLVKLEDAVADNWSLVRLSNKNGAYVHNTATNAATNPDSINTLVEDTSYNWGIYNSAKSDSNVDGDYITNVNEFDGNVSAYMSGKDARYLHFGILSDSTFRGKAYGFKTVYDSSYDMTILLATAHANNYEAGSKVVLSQGNDKEATPHVEFWGCSSYITNYKYADVLSGMNTAKGRTDTELFKDGDVLTIYYGAYYTTAGDDGVTYNNKQANYYLRIDNETKGYTVLEITETPTRFESYNTNGAVTFNYSNMIRFGASSFSVKMVPNDGDTNNAFVVGGVDKPIFGEIDTKITVNADLSKVSTLSDIVLPAGYSFKDPTVTCDKTATFAGEFNYYGNKTDCTITVVDATELEDIVDGLDNIYWRMNRSGVSGENIQGQKYKYENNMNELNTYGSSSNATTKHAWALFDTADETIKEVTHTQPASGEITETININGNKYAGNYSFFTTETQENIVYFKNDDANARNRIVSFRTNFENNGALIIRAGNLNTGALQTTNASYCIDLTSASVAVCKGASLANTNVLQKNVFITPIVVGDELIITFGAYDLNEKTYVYINIYNVTRDFVVVNATYEGDLDTATKETYYSAFSFSRQFNSTDKNVTPVVIGGINEPLLANYDYTVEEKLAGDKIGLSVKDALTLKENYSFVNENQKLVVGENVIPVTYALSAKDYYVASDRLATVTVTVEGNQVTIKDMNGGEISSETVGGEFVLPTLERAKTFLAYKVGDTLYKQGEKVTLTGDTIVTLYEIDMKVEEKVSVRLANSENGFGGLRFTAKILTSDLTVLTAAGFEVATAIVPLDLIEDASMVRYGELSDTEIVEDYTVAYFTITDLNYHNYNREYAGRVAVKVGSEYVYSATVSESAYTAALAAYGEDTAALINTGEGLYSAANLAILEEYVFGVIDLTYTVDGDQATVKYTDENGLGESWFGLKGVTSAAVEENILTVTAEIEVGAKAADLVADGNAPVIVRNSNNVSAYKPATIDARSVQDGVLTITFRVKLA